MYASDTWKLTSKLTMNYGLRWEPFLPVFLPNIGPFPGATYNFDYNRFAQGVYSTVFTNEISRVLISACRFSVASSAR